MASKSEFPPKSATPKSAKRLVLISLAGGRASAHRSDDPVLDLKAYTGECLKVDTLIAIEVKGTNRLTKNDFKGIHALQSEKSLKHHIIVCLEPMPREAEGVDVLPWQHFRKDLCSGKFK